MFTLAEYAKEATELKKKILDVLDKTNTEYIDKRIDKKKIQLVFVGEYSAGKSSIIKMLTGDDNIEIGAAVTTQKAHTFEWNGLELVDTPGIHAEMNPVHDEISYSAIASSDMLVFVISNMLFDSYMANHFRKLAIDHDKEGEMILVVNKMEKTAKGNTLEQQGIIREDLRRVLAPCTPEKLRVCFIDALSYLDSVELKDEDPDLSKELFGRSGYNDFIATLNHFVKEKGMIGRLTTELYQLEGCLQNAIKKVEPESGDKDIDAFKEKLLQERHAYSDARTRVLQELKDIYSNAANTVRRYGDEAADLLVEGCKQKEVEEGLAQKIQAAKDVMENCQNDAEGILRTRLFETQEDIDAIESDEISIRLKARLSGKFDSLPVNVKKAFGNVAEQAQKAGNIVLHKAYNASSQGGLRLSNFSGSPIHELVKKTGHQLGYKFKPWEAIKITKTIAIGSQILGILGVGLTVFMQVKSDQDAEKLRIELRENRTNIRRQFNQAANELVEFGNNYIKEQMSNTFDVKIQEHDEKLRMLRKDIANRTDLCRYMDKLDNECYSLIRKIHEA